MVCPWGGYLADHRGGKTDKNTLVRPFTGGAEISRPAKGVEHKAKGWGNFGQKLIDSQRGGVGQHKGRVFWTETNTIKNLVLIREKGVVGIDLSGEGGTNGLTQKKSHSRIRV